MLERKDRPLLYLRYGLARKKEFLRDFKTLYDGIVLPANVLLYQYKGTPAVVFRAGQPFFVDPMSYLFAHPLEDFKKRVEKGSPKFKPSFSKLIQGYGENPDYFLRPNYLTLVDYLLSNEGRLRPFIENCLKFQWSNVNDTINASKDLLPDNREVTLRPSFVIPPYFAYKSFDRTDELNHKIADLAAKIKGENDLGDVFPMIFIEKENLNANFIDKINAGFKDLDFPGYCIWIENFDERNARKDQIAGLIRLITTFSERGKKQIVILFGGFFTLLLSKFGVNCISHGIAYSEAKSMFAAVKQLGGGSLVRYYIPDIHQFHTIENALIILRKRPDLICSCPVCRRVVQGNPENIARFEKEEELAELHFLINRYNERKMIASWTASDTIKYLRYLITVNADIENITKRYKKGYGYEEQSLVNGDYVMEWLNAIEEYAK